MSGSKNSTPPTFDDPNALRTGFTPQSENWNGRFAMIGFVTIILIEALTGQGFLHFWGIM